MRGSSVAGALIGALFLLLLAAAVLPGAPALPPTGPALVDVGTALWEGRPLEVLLQGFILLGGAAGVLLFLGSRTHRGESP